MATETPQTEEAAGEEWILRLYVAGQTQNSLAAFANLKKICETHLGGRYRIEVIDLLKNPKLAAGDQILAIPTLVRKLPTPIKKIIGDLSNEERVLVGLDLRPVQQVAVQQQVQQPIGHALRDKVEPPGVVGAIPLGGQGGLVGQLELQAARAQLLQRRIRRVEVELLQPVVVPANGALQATVQI